MVLPPFWMVIIIYTIGYNIKDKGLKDLNYFKILHPITDKMRYNT